MGKKEVGGGCVSPHIIDKVMYVIVWIYCPWRLALQWIGILTSHAVGLRINDTANLEGSKGFHIKQSYPIIMDCAQVSITKTDVIFWKKNWGEA